MPPLEVILASTSLYRRALLARLQVEFRCIAPRTEENALDAEAPEVIALRLALSKARDVAQLNPEALVIGSDQVAAVGDQALGKPGNFHTAMRQLQDSSGQAVQFYTAVAVVCLHRKFERFHVEPFTVQFRSLSDVQIANYLRREQPYDCAGSFKAEGLGIALFEKMTGDDPTSLEGLPLIKLTELLAAAGLDVLRV